MIKNGTPPSCPEDRPHSSLDSRQDTISTKCFPFGRIALLSLLALLVLAVLLNWIPALLALTVPLLLGLVAFAIKFRHDNRNLVSGVTRWRFIASSLVGFLRFIPGLLIIAVACLIVWGFDFVVGKGTDQLKHWAESEKVITIKSRKLVDRHPWSPLRLVMGDKKLVKQTYDFSKGQSASIKFAVKTAVNFLEVVTWYPWFFLGYVALRSYFHFWARAFVARGGTVTMQFPEVMRP